jgi:PTS system mannose-specific IID component
MPLRSDRLAAWARTFTVQGSWNYRTLVGTGIAYCMLPLLRRIYAGDPVRMRDAVGRHMQSFNAHPYLSAMAVAALARLEQEGTDAETIDRFRTAMRGPLGTVGDRAIWAQWRPLCLLMAILAFTLGASPFAAVLIFLVPYNAGHLVVRSWAFMKGWDAGIEVGKLLKGSWVERLGAHMWPANLVLLGFVWVLLGARIVGGTGAGTPGAVLLGVGVVLALAAFRFPRQGGRVAGLLLLIATVVWLVGDWLA